MARRTRSSLRSTSPSASGPAAGVCGMSPIVSRRGPRGTGRTGPRGGSPVAGVRDLQPPALSWRLRSTSIRSAAVQLRSMLP